MQVRKDRGALPRNNTTRMFKRTDLSAVSSPSSDSLAVKVLNSSTFLPLDYLSHKQAGHERWHFSSSVHWFHDQKSLGVFLQQHSDILLVSLKSFKQAILWSAACSGQTPEGHLPHAPHVTITYHRSTAVAFQPRHVFTNFTFGAQKRNWESRYISAAQQYT